jgi:hypothetical protein
MTTKDEIARLVREIKPRYWHMSGARQKMRIECWKGDDYYKSSIHFHWNWNGRGHWLCVFIPELA